ncbi:MAG: hypothetical protein KA521_05680 [Crocinitomicaceae bacterium]|nr:hypothetical protein [Crocinitomicaceae bacterium]
MEKILVLHYSQSGQLTEILENFTRSFPSNTIDFVTINPAKAYTFPWTSASFYKEMPASVLELETPLESIQFKHDSYDLIILGYQPWFLSPSVPTTSLLKNDMVQKLIKNTPVVTVIGARNMWLNAQESVKKRIEDAGGMLVGNVPLIDKNPNLISAITILHWMSTGKKSKKWGIFPLPGISDEDIKNCTVFGDLLFNHFQNDHLSTYQDQIIAQKGIEISDSILFIEERAKKIFKIWAKVIASKSNKKNWLVAFRFYLLVALFGVAPILLIINTLLLAPLTRNQIKRKKSYFYHTELKKS